MKRKLFIILSTLVLIITLLFSFVFKDNKIESKREISKVEKILSKPEGIQAYTLNGEKTNIAFNELINGYTINKITCKNGSSATYNKMTNEVSLSNIHVPDYCTMDFKHSIYSKLLADNTTIKTRTDFSTTYTETNTGTLFKSTESIAGSTTKDVYYFAGDAKNNWVKFAGYYWRIIRTNHDGSIRLLYAGTSPDTTSGYIGKSTFNTESNSPKYVGYMYGEDDSTLEGIRANTKDSTIKTYIDNWYSNNLSDYTIYLSKDVVYCNDRKVPSYSASNSFHYYVFTRLKAMSPTYDCENIKDAFSVNNNEAKLTYSIGLMTADEITYAGGYRDTSLTSPYAWYYLNSVGSSITGDSYWLLLSSLLWDGTNVHGWVARASNSPGELHGTNVSTSSGVRPVISLKGNLIWKSGDGSSVSPYEVEDLPPTLSEKLLADNTTIKTRTDFSTTYTETNTGTLFKSTESIAGSTPKEVYYFAGDAKNNWVKFGGFYWRIIRTNHDGSIRLLYSGTSPDTTEGYIGASAFNTENDSPKYIGYMYGEDDSTLDGIRANTKDSTIKTYIDNWYSNNLSDYTKYLSKDVVYCNDRKAPSYSVSNSFHYDVLTRLKAMSPTYDCENIKDAFSVSNNEAKLTYSIGLMTADEITYAGGYRDTSLTSPYAWYYLNSVGSSITGNLNWLLLSSLLWDGTNVHGWFTRAYSPGELHGINVSTSVSVRPVISLKSCTLWSQGDGSSSNPYEIDLNGGC